MIKLEIYDGTKNYVAPSGDLCTPDFMRLKFVAIDTFKHIIQTDESGEICYAVQLFSAMKNQLNIDISAYSSDEEVLVAMEEILNAPQPEAEPSPEERMASALEFQNLLTM